MTEYLVTFNLDDAVPLGMHLPRQPVHVPTGTLLTEAAHQAGVEIAQPCGGQGRCGRCAVHVTAGDVRRRSTLRLTAEDVAAGYTLACQSVVEGDVSVTVPLQEKIERRLTTDRVVAEVQVPIGYDHRSMQTIQRVALTLTPPSVDDQTDDWSRLTTALRQQAGVEEVRVSLPLLRRLGPILRDAEWNVVAVFESEIEDQKPDIRLIDLRLDQTPLFGLAIDIGTTTVSCWLVDLISGQVVAQAAEYNDQIARGEDVISRIIYAGKNGSGFEMQALVLETINFLIAAVCEKAKVVPKDIFKATIAGNSTMVHLLLNMPASSIRLAPFVTAINHVPLLTARDLGLNINPEATIDCLPGVASYVGADITAGVLASGMEDSEQLTLFMDVGTNGEIVLGSRDWLVTCACSAGPAFEGAGVVNGMRATRGAIEEVWINSDTHEPTYRVIGNAKPRGICGSGLISLLSEMFITGVLDKGGNLNTHLLPHPPTPSPEIKQPISKEGEQRSRVRSGEHGLEYVVAWAAETWHGHDIVVTHVDVDNLLRAKAAIYAGFSVLADRVGVPLESVERFLIGGSFGKYINVEKAVQIGLLPDMPWDRFAFLGNTSVKGTYLALLDRHQRERISEIASRMTYIELSADNTFYEAFTSALFLPHTDLAKFPSVASALSKT
ncbi:MAG TPA: ASKHA domain-containing protein [Anaerolineae bacterium]|nr:ASKHA domain-containing protein [Anaerolineae bacterium]